MAALCKLAEHCNYGRSLNEMLCDRLVCRIANPTMQKRLLDEPDLTLDRAVSMAQAAKLADKGAKELQSANDKSVNDVHKLIMVLNKEELTRIHLLKTRQVATAIIVVANTVS